MTNYKEEIAQTIFIQLGGKEFAIMTGLKNIWSLGGNNLRAGGALFEFKDGFFFKVELTSKDLYDVEYYPVSNLKSGIQGEKDLYLDMLRDSFTRLTGYHTYMPNILRK